jgi:hypothetical protein
MFTGRTCIDGEHRTRLELAHEVSGRGATPVVGTRNRGVTLLVQGELGDNVTDPRTGRSQSARFVEDERAAGNHICIVDDLGISSLLRGEHAACLRTRVIKADMIEFSLPIPRKS